MMLLYKKLGLILIIGKVGKTKKYFPKDVDILNLAYYI